MIAETGMINVSPADALEVDLRQRARHQLALAIVHVDFNQQCAAGRVDRVRGAHQRPLKGFPRMLGKRNVDLRAALDVVRVQLRHVGINAQRLQRLHVKQLLRRARIDQLPDIDAARGNHSVEGRINLFESTAAPSADPRWPARS